MRFLSDKIFGLLIGLLLLSQLVLAQPNTVTVIETIYLPDNTKARGTVSVQLNAKCSAPPLSSLVYGGRVNSIPLVNGVFTATLVPNANCNPVTSYYVSYNLSNQYGVAQPRDNETWYIPASPTTTTIQAVRIGSMPSSPLTVNFSQLIGASFGDVFYGNNSGGVSRLAGGTTTLKKFLSQVGTGSASAIPVWNTLIDGAPVTPGCLHTIDGVTIVSTGIACGSGSGGGTSSGLVTSYGAACNGVTDDTAAFAAAITDAVNGNISSVRVPKATCLVGNLNITANNIRIEGYGWGSVIKKIGNNPIMTVSGDYFQLAGVKLDGDGGTYTGKGVVFSGTSYAPYLRDVWITGTAGCTVYFAAQTSQYANVIDGMYTSSDANGASFCFPVSTDHTNAMRRFTNLTTAGQPFGNLNYATSTHLTQVYTADLQTGPNTVGLRMVNSRVRGQTLSSLDVFGSFIEISNTAFAIPVVVDEDTTFCSFSGVTTDGGLTDNSRRCLVQADQKVISGQLLLGRRDTNPEVLLTNSGAGTYAGLAAGWMTGSSVSSSYNGICLVSNSSSLSSTGNTTLPAWGLDLGGCNVDNFTSTTDAFGVWRKAPAGGWTRLARITDQGALYLTGDLYLHNDTLIKKVGSGIFGIDNQSGGTMSIAATYGAMSGVYPVLGGYSGTGADNVSLSWGDNSGRRFVMGANIAGVFTPRFSFFDTGVLRFDQAITFANLATSGSTTNGTLLYCSDCQEVNPCAGGGTGAIARRVGDAWNCGGGSGSSSGGSYSAAVSSGTTWTILGTTHNLATCDLVATAYVVSGSTRTKIETGEFSCDSTTKDVTINWSVATAGRIVLGTGGGGSGNATLTIVNSGTGAEILKADTALEARTLVAGNNISIVQGTDDITISAASQANPSNTFTNQTSVTIIHNLGTENVLFQCYDTSKNAIGVNSMNVVDANSYTVTFSVSQSGYCNTNGTGGGSGGGGGSGDTTIPTNSGAGAQVLKTSTNVIGRTLVAGTNVTVTQNTDTITIAAASGSESTTPTNSGAGTAILKTATNVVAKSLVAGTNVTITNDADTVTIAAASGSNETLGLGMTRANGPLEVNPNTVPTYISFSASLNFPNIAPNSYQDLTISVPAALTGMAVAPAWPSNIDAALTGMMFVSANGTVTVRLRNNTTGNIDPADTNYAGMIVTTF